MQVRDDELKELLSIQAAVDATLHIFRCQLSGGADAYAATCERIASYWRDGYAIGGRSGGHLFLGLHLLFPGDRFSRVHRRHDHEADLGAPGPAHSGATVGVATRLGTD